jgi:hypothetical protein
VKRDHGESSNIGRDELKRATEVERELLRIEDRYHELIAKVSAQSLGKTSVFRELDELQAEQLELRIRVADARGANTLHAIYCDALDLRIDALLGLDGVVRRKMRERASS